MNKKEFAEYIRERVRETWGVSLAETLKSSLIWTYKLINDYSEDEIMGAAEWLKTWETPRNMAQLYSVMPKYLEEQKKHAWEYA